MCSIRSRTGYCASSTISTPSSTWTGGTAASRGYLGHRFSDDLDLFVNDATIRREPKDLADVWAFCCRLGLPLAVALDGASSKAAGVFPADVARRLCTATVEDWKLVRWIEEPEAEQFVSDLCRLGEELLLVR
jgi:hypothetical protein